MDNRRRTLHHGISSLELCSGEQINVIHTCVIQNNELLDLLFNRNTSDFFNIFYE